MWAVQEGERWKKAACGAGGAEHIAWGALGRLGEKQQGGQETWGSLSARLRGLAAENQRGRGGNELLEELCPALGTRLGAAAIPAHRCAAGPTAGKPRRKHAGELGPCLSSEHHLGMAASLAALPPSNPSSCGLSRAGSRVQGWGAGMAASLSWRSGWEYFPFCPADNASSGGTDVPMDLQPTVKFRMADRGVRDFYGMPSTLSSVKPQQLSQSGYWL